MPYKQQGYNNLIMNIVVMRWQLCHLYAFLLIILPSNPNHTN